MNYALIKNGVVENIIVADEAFVSTLSGYDHIEALDTPEEQKVAGPGWLYDAGTGVFSEPPVPQNDTWKITKLAFKTRFPRQKWMAAKAAAEVSPEMADFFETFNLATYIDLQREDTIADVSYLKNELIPESFRLTEAEYTTVMLVPAKPEEIPTFI